MPTEVLMCFILVLLYFFIERIPPLTATDHNPVAAVSDNKMLVFLKYGFFYFTGTVFIEQKTS